jgi:hypothetical protein
MYINNTDNIKLTNIQNKYITNIDGKPKMKNKIFSNNQSISYNTQGELIIDEQCLTQNSGKVYFDKCKNEKKQLWKINNNKIYSVESPELCLSSSGENISISKCLDENQNDDSNTWTIEESDVEKTSDYKPIKYKGKSIVLVDSENPWYLNYDTTIPIEYYKKQIMTPKQYRSDSDYGSNENLEFEHFNNNKNNNNISDNSESTSQNQIIFLLLIIVAILFVYKKLIKKNEVK